MRALQRRLRRIEALVVDGSGLRPKSPEWVDHWMSRLSRILAGEEPGAPGCIPLDVWDAIDVDGATGSQNLAQMACVGHDGGAEIASDNA